MPGRCLMTSRRPTQIGFAGEEVLLLPIEIASRQKVQNAMDHLFAAVGDRQWEEQDKQLSKTKAWSELSSCMEARAASFAVLVVAGEENVPSGREQLTEYEGNKLIVAVDRDDPSGLSLGVAYRLAAARVAMARDRDLTVDAPAVRDAAQEAVTALKQAQAIRSALTGIKTQSDRARGGLDGMVEAVEAKLALIDSLVAEADEAEAEAG